MLSGTISNVLDISRLLSIFLALLFVSQLSFSSVKGTSEAKSKSSFNANLYGDAKISGPLIAIEKEEFQRQFPRLIGSYNCFALWQDHKAVVEWPPPRKIPEHFLYSFTLGGRIPVEPFYFAQKYAGTTALHSIWSFKDVNRYVQATHKLRKSLTRNANSKSIPLKLIPRISRYGAQNTLDIALAMKKWQIEIQNKHILVVGSERPWLEGMLIGFGAKKVTTLEYGSIISEHPIISTVTVANLTKAVLQNNHEYFGLFDTAFSYSSIEHSGLGRYGDQINPFGDIEQVAQISCLLKTGGIFFLGFGIGKDKVEFNAHRIYGKLRLPLVTINFKLMDIIGKFSWEKANWKIQPIMVLKNIFKPG